MAIRPVKSVFLSYLPPLTHSLHPSHTVLAVLETNQVHSCLCRPLPGGVPPSNILMAKSFTSVIYVYYGYLRISNSALKDEKNNWMDKIPKIH